MKVYQELASRISAYQNCITYNNTIWEEKHKEVIDEIIDSLPHGSGIDGKTECDITNSTDQKIIIESCYHCMNDNGYYDGWVDFKIIISASLSLGFNIKITGKFGKYRSIVLDYLEETFAYALNKEYEK